MITLFTIPKTFCGHIATIQRNAIRSWTLMRPRCEIILFGDEEGTTTVAAEMNVRHIPIIARNEYGTPLVSDAFEQTAKCSTKDILGYINSDILLFDDFLAAIDRIANKKRKFLMIGQRWDLDIDQQINFSQNWQLQVRNLISDCGTLHPRYGIDYFVFPRGLFENIPPFAVGRPGWDNWMVYQAKNSGYSVIDATKAVTAVHQNHDYSHVPKRVGLKYNGPEGTRNRELMGDKSHILTIDDANYVLTKRLIRPALTRRIKKPIESSIISIKNYIIKYKKWI